MQYIQKINPQIILPFQPSNLNTLSIFATLLAPCIQFQTTQYTPFKVQTQIGISKELKLHLCSLTALLEYINKNMCIHIYPRHFFDLAFTQVETNSYASCFIWCEPHMWKFLWYAYFVNKPLIRIFAFKISQIT